MSTTENSIATCPSANNPSLSPSRAAAPPQLVLVGHREARRTVLFQQALAALGWPAADVVPWADLLQGNIRLGQVVRAGAVVRLDSPGRDFLVERLLLHRGAQIPDRLGYEHIAPANSLALPYRKGEILASRQWYRGFASALEMITSQLRAAPPHRLLSDCAEVAILFDKPRCHAQLHTRGVTVPRTLATPDHPVLSYSDLLARMATHRIWRVFVKLAHGSSASGIVALQVQGTRQHATTTTELVHEAGQVRLYNSRRIRTLTDPTQIATLIDALCRHGVHVEQWVPKAGLAGRTFDLRILGIAGQPRHVVVRTSCTPLTNLHLLNQRGDVAPVRARVGEAHWASVLATCRAALACFPRTHGIGIDLVIRADLRAHAIVELNAFGDLLPGILHEGQDAYTAQLLRLPERATIAS